MQVESIVQLVGSGNFKTVEQEWLGVLGQDHTRVDDVLALRPVLEAMVARGNTPAAESLAWAAVEQFKENRSAADALSLAKYFLMVLPQSAELRKETAALYRLVHPGRDGLDELIETSGLLGARPPRRATRTLDVCLEIQPGSYALSRHEDGAARVESIEQGTWTIGYHDGQAESSSGPMEFADAYLPCDAGDYRILYHFARERLAGLLATDPVAVVLSVVRTRQDRTIDSDALEAVLTPHILSSDEWPKWWTRARTALKQTEGVKLEGRAPYVIKEVVDGASHSDEFEGALAGLHTAGEQMEALESHLRECRARKKSADGKMLLRLRTLVAQRAQRLEKSGATMAVQERIVEWQLAEAAGEQNADSVAVKLLTGAKDPTAILRACESASLWRAVCDCLTKSHPEKWPDLIAAAFPSAPMGACDDLARRLESAPPDADRIDRIAQVILADSLRYYQALAWLWDRGASGESWKSASAVSVLTRMLSLTSEVERNEKIPPATSRDVRATIKNVLSARKYERFAACLKQVEPGMAAALRTQLQRMHGLGRNVREDLLNRLRDAFPELYVKIVTPPWALEDVLFSTRAGIARLEGDIDDLVNVKMRENAKAIGAAAEKGDLSENSEYKFALEERDLLRARLAQMQGQLTMMRPLHPEEVPLDHVTVGSRVVLRNTEKGAPFEMTFLGPFDADIHRHIYNYKAPFAQAIMGHQVGDRIELQLSDLKGTFEIVELRAWDPASRTGRPAVSVDVDDPPAPEFAPPAASAAGR